MYMLGRHCYELEVFAVINGADELAETPPVSFVHPEKLGAVQRIRRNGLAVRCNRSHHARLVSGDTIPTERQAVVVDHRNSMFIATTHCTHPCRVAGGDEMATLYGVVPRTVAVHALTLSKAP